MVDLSYKIPTSAWFHWALFVLLAYFWDEALLVLNLCEGVIIIRFDMICG